MNLTDRVFVALVLTLALLALFIERKQWRRGLSADVKPPIARSWLLPQMNLPRKRYAEIVVEDVGYMDVTNAAIAGGEPAQ